MACLKDWKILREGELQNTFANSSHVVILGAGASIAAIPNGDLNGKRISSMYGFIQNAGLENILSNLRLDTESNNLEEIYTEIHEKAQSDREFQNAEQLLQDGIRKYISSFEITKECTVYDYLLHALTEKDHIISFNWDSLLLQAYHRVHSQFVGHLPKLLFLHGNVGVGYCSACNAFGDIGKSCVRCSSLYQSMPLLLV